MQLIKALLFDADGPLYKRGSEVTKQKVALLQKYGYTGDYHLFEQAYDKEKFRAYDRTESAEAMFVNIMATLGGQLDPEQSNVFTAAFNKIQSQLKPSPQAQATLQWLHEHHYKVCVLTDSFYPAQEKWLWFQVLQMSQYIDEIVSSYDVRTLKDSREAYAACLDRLAVSADEALFVGHQQYEMDGAKRAGITSVCIRPIAIPSTTHGDYDIQSLSELETLLSS